MTWPNSVKIHVFLFEKKKRSLFINNIRGFLIAGIPLIPVIIVLAIDYDMYYGGKG